MLTKLLYFYFIGTWPSCVISIFLLSRRDLEWTNTFFSAN